METLLTSYDPSYPQDRDPIPNNLPASDENPDIIKFTGPSQIDPDSPIDRRICLEPLPIVLPVNERVVLPTDFTAGSNWRDRLEAARANLPITLAWELLRLDGSPSSSCNSPFRRDLNPSFSITPDGQRWKDWGTDEGGDVFDFIANAMSLPIGDAMRVGIQIAESGVLPLGVTPGSYVSKRRDEVLREKAEQRKLWPPMNPPSEAELKTIAELRGISIEGLKLAVADGVLVTTTWYREAAWCVRSRCCHNCQARTMSGKPWGMIDGKAKTLRGSLGCIPIGLPADKPIIALCEGGPDMLAAYDCIQELGLRDQVGAVGMMGSTSNFSSESLEHMRGKRVRIFIDRDEAGRQAAAKWATQLRSVGADVDGFEFDDVTRSDGKFVKDLNDLVRLPRCETSNSFIRKAFNFNN